MMGHLGSRASALLDGQLPAAEAERAWAHVHACHACRDLVEREGWIKTRLQGLSFGNACAPEGLKGSLLEPTACTPQLAAPHFPVYADRSRRSLGMVALGGSAVGAAVVGVLALGIGPGGTPVDRQTPATNIRQDTPTQVPELRRTTRP